MMSLKDVKFTLAVAFGMYAVIGVVTAIAYESAWRAWFAGGCMVGCLALCGRFR